MKDDADFMSSIIKNPNNYIAFANEIELCAGFSKKDESYLETVYEKTKSTFKCINSRYQKLGSIDKNLAIKLEQVF